MMTQMMKMQEDTNAANKALEAKVKALERKNAPPEIKIVKAVVVVLEGLHVEHGQEQVVADNMKQRIVKEWSEDAAVQIYKIQEPGIRYAWFGKSAGAATLTAQKANMKKLYLAFEDTQVAVCF